MEPEICGWQLLEVSWELLSLNDRDHFAGPFTWFPIASRIKTKIPNSVFEAFCILDRAPEHNLIGVP